MRAASLFRELKRKLRVATNRDLQKKLGMSHMALLNWRDRGALTPRQIANAIYKARYAAIADAQIKTIQPIVEYFPLKAKESKQGIRYELFDTSASAGASYIALRRALENANGIYVFYDSRGRALYAGKAKQLSLWTEMKNAFNRHREMQKVYRVKHPVRMKEFRPAYEKNRQPRRRDLPLSNLAAYVSAFQVDEGMINDLEALLVRGFANDLLNARMERFAHARAASARRRRKRKKAQKKGL
jgi:hypothetical protein